MVTRAFRWQLLVLTALLLAGTPFSNAQEPTPGSSYFHFSLAKLYHVNREYPEAIAEFEKAVELDSGSATLRTEFAETLLEAGELERSLELSQSAIGIDPESVPARLALARTYLAMRSPEAVQQAVTEFEQVLALDPENDEALNFMGQIHFQRRDYEKAAETFARLIQIDGGNVRAYFMQGQALRQLGRHGDAIDVLEEGLRVRPDIPEFLTLLAESYEADGRVEDAIPRYERAYSLSPNADLGKHLARLQLENGHTDEALALLEELIAADPQQRELQVELGRTLKVARRYEEAVEVLQKVVDANENDLEANFELGVSLSLIGDREAASRRLEHILEITQPTPFRKHVKLNLALIYQETRNFDGALEILEELAADSPGDLDAKLRLFYTFQQAGRTAEAAEVAGVLRSEHPESPYTAIAGAQVMADSGRLDEAVAQLRQELEGVADADMLYGELSRLYMDVGRFEDAERVVQEALSVDPSSSRMRYLLGAVLERQKKYEGAEQQFAELLRINPEDSDALNYLGYMLADRGVRLPEALEYLQKAVSIDPYNGSYLDSLGWAYFKLDRLQDAEDHLRKANRINSFDPVILEHLGDLYLRLGDAEQARSYYEQSLTFSEEEEELARVQEKLEQVRRRANR